MEKKVVIVPDIGCDGCVRTVESELSALDGVSVVKAELDTKQVTVEWGTPASWDSIKSKLVEIEYPPAE